MATISIALSRLVCDGIHLNLEDGTSSLPSQLSLSKPFTPLWGNHILQGFAGKITGDIGIPDQTIRLHQYDASDRIQLEKLVAESRFGLIQFKNLEVITWGSVLHEKLLGEFKRIRGN